MRAGWGPVALSADIVPGTSAGTVVEGQELVVWRDSGGRVHVWEDRCPHRGMKLSFGFVRGDHIACLYHGWQYDCAGQCRLIPAHPDLEVPATIRVAVHPVAEAAGVVWAAPGGAAGPEPAAATVVPLRSLAIDAGAGAVLAALATPGLPGGDAVLAEAGPALLRLSAGPVALRVAVQCHGPEATTLHLALEGDAADPALLRGLAQWAVGLRHRVEAAA